MASDRKIIAELNGSSQFRFYVDKLRIAQAKAIEDVLNCDVKTLQDRRSYARCLSELITESTKPGDEQ